MRKQIYISISGAILVAITFFNIVIASHLYFSLWNQNIDALMAETYKVEQMLASYGDDYLENMSSFTTSSRITIIASDGLVLFDNQHDIFDMENHAERPEFISALLTDTGEDTRRSDTLGDETYYFATLLDDGNILRLAFTTSTIYSLFFTSVPMFLFISFLFVICAMLVARFLTNRIIKEVYPENPNIFEELQPFVSKIERQEKYIESQKMKLDQKIIEFDIISQNISEGLILLDSRQNILSINKTAVKILGKRNFNYNDKSFLELTRNYKLHDFIKKAYAGEFVEETLTINDRFYSFHMSPIFRYQKVLGVTILIIDNTKNIEAEKIRREFSANVSHELKTPLTSISGYAELIKSGLVQPKDIIPFAENIYNESVILIDLIEDIIKISRLDENKRDFSYETINLLSLIETILPRLSMQAKEKNITIETTLLSENIYGVVSIMQEIFYNLIQNAIKYNKQDGKIKIYMYPDGDNIVTEISDTGIGIPKESLSRIFERFYRVDTSRSKEISGSGLGLSIVKHGVILHDGTISVDSTVDEFTKFTITLPKYKD